MLKPLRETELYGVLLRGAHALCTCNVISCFQIPASAFASAYYFSLRRTTTSRLLQSQSDAALRAHSTPLLLAA